MTLILTAMMGFAFGVFQCKPLAPFLASLVAVAIAWSEGYAMMVLVFVAAQMGYVVGLSVIAVIPGE